MAAPISNNNPALIDHRKADSTNNNESGNGSSATGSNDETAARRQDDAVSVSKAAQALGSSATSLEAGNIETADQAAELAQNIASFFAENGPGALAAHDNGNAGLAGLLKTS